MKRKRTVYIRIGSQKTGSTSIQNFLFQNKESLVKKGLYYLNGPNRSSSTPIAWFFGFGLKNCPYQEEYENNNQKFKFKIKQELSDVLKMNFNILISSEIFFGKQNKKELLEKLKDYFSEFNIKIIVYIRRQDFFIESHYSQQVKNGYSGTIKDWIFYEKLGKQFSWYDEEWLDWYKEIKRWSNIFGKKNIIVRLFEKRQMKNEDVCLDFLNLLGIKNKKSFIKNSKIINKTPSFEIIEIARRFNSLPFFGIKTKKYFRDILLFRKRGGVPEKFFEKKEKHLLSPQERLNIIRKFEKSNARIAKEFLGRKDGRLFYEPYPDLSESWSIVNVSLRKEIGFYVFILGFFASKKIIFYKNKFRGFRNKVRLELRKILKILLKKN